MARKAECGTTPRSPKGGKEVDLREFSPSIASSWRLNVSFPMFAMNITFAFGVYSPYIPKSFEFNQFQEENR